MALPPGTQLGRYEILSVIGLGGMGEVYRARDTSLKREVAVKILPERFSADVARLARFQREAEVLASLNHSNIASIYALEGADGVQALVMELVEGEDLAERIAHGAIPLDEALPIAEQIAEALEAAHEQGIIHRDLKPANVKVRADSVVKVLDFGLAKALEVESGMSPSGGDSPTVTTPAKMTAVGVLLGTLAYMPPEQALGEELDARSDIFSLGVTIYEMATGTLPFKGPTWAAVINEILNKPPLSASLINSEIPPELDRLIGKALEKDRALRYQTVSDLAIDLKRIRRGLQPGAAENRSIVGPAHHRAGEHSTASLRADAGFARPVLPTEAINPRSVALDNAPVSEILEMMANEDRRVVAAVHHEKERIEQGVEIITQALRTGGRLIFIGAGTSGRLGALEAAEMPPTFGTSPHVVLAIVPGGQEQVFRYKGQSEAEDRYEDGVRSIARLRVSKTDVVVGISASGTTPFVRGALTRTRKTGAKMILVTCWAGSDLQTFVDVMIAPAVGPEIIAGSTRLKAGTATKMVLNMLTTASMVRLGKTYGNLMVDVQTRSDKLKDRARRIFVIVTGLDYDQADELLRRAHWNVKAAIVMQKLSLSYVDALNRLKNSQGSIREATGEDIEHRLRELLRIDRVSP
jgi:N-acetylmuramic acid 6-phosphate etherase